MCILVRGDGWGGGGGGGGGEDSTDIDSLKAWRKSQQICLFHHNTVLILITQPNTRVERGATKYEVCWGEGGGGGGGGGGLREAVDTGDGGVWLGREGSTEVGGGGG